MKYRRTDTLGGLRVVSEEKNWAASMREFQYVFFFGMFRKPNFVLDGVPKLNPAVWGAEDSVEQLPVLFEDERK